MQYMWVFGAVLLIVTAWFLSIGLRGLIAKRPVIFPARHNFWLMVLAIAPSLIFPGRFLLDKQMASFSMLTLLLPFLLWGVFLVMMWKAMRGYVVIGMTEDSLRESIHYALNKLHLPFEETLSKLRLTTLNADLNVAIQSWMGTAQLRIKGSQQDETLKKIADAMNESFALPSTRMNLTTNIFYIITGVILIVSAIFLSITGWYLSSRLADPPANFQPQAYLETK